MKISCEIIRDLLPLYHDGVCSEESKELVEEHVAYCEECRAELAFMDENLQASHATENLKEAEAVKKMAKKWKQSKWLSLLRGVGIGLGVMVLLLLFLSLFMDFKFTVTP